MSRRRRVAVCLPQVPFEHGGAEILAATLVERLRARDLDADLVTVPYIWNPNRDLLANAVMWRTLDLTSANGRPIDALIATKFPSYLARHPRKVVWLFHQFRQAYDMHGTEFAQFGDDPEGLAMRDSIAAMDARGLGEARALFSISQNVADRLRRFNGLEATSLPPPPQRLDLAWIADDGEILSVGRLDRAKRVDLLIAALAHAPEARAVIVGGGPDEERLREAARRAGVADRVDFRGRVDEAALAEAYGRARAVFYAPFDEDYGFVPLEAHLAGKPVITTLDAGGALENVVDGESGIVCAPEPAAIAAAIAALAADPERARTMGAAGQARARLIDWDAVIDRLLAAADL